MKKNYAAVALATVVLATSTPFTVLADEGVATEATENTSEKEEKETSDSSEKEEKESSDSSESKDSESDEAESSDSASDKEAESSDSESDDSESDDSASDKEVESNDSETGDTESENDVSEQDNESNDSESNAAEDEDADSTEDKSAESDAENASDKEDESSAEVSETVDADSEKKEEAEETVAETEASEEKTEEVSETETEAEVISDDLDIDLELVDEMMQDDYLDQYEEYYDPHGCLPVVGDSEFHLVMTDEYDTETSNWEVPGYPGHITDDQPAFLIWYYDQAEDDPYCYRDKENRAVNFVVRDPNKSTDAAPVYGVRRYDGYARKEEYYIFTKGGRFDITDTFLKGIKYYMQQQESATGYVKDTQINVFCTDAQYVGGEDVAENPFGESAAVRHLDATTTVRFINKRELEGNDEVGEEPEVIIPEEPEVVVPVEPTEEPEIVVPAEPTPEVPEVVSEDPTPVAPAEELTPVREVVAPKNEAPVVVNVSVKSERTRVKTDGDVLEAREVAAPMIAPPAPMMAPPAAIEAGHGIPSARCRNGSCKKQRTDW